MKSCALFLLVAISLVVTGVGCAKHTVISNPGVVTKSFVALGDSYTIGELVTENERFAAQTSAILQQDKINISPLTYIAKTGWRTDQILQGISATNLLTKYDLVTVLAGVNDEYQQVDTATFRANYTALIEKAIQLSGNNPAHVFVLSMPDYSVTPSVPESNKASVSADIDVFNGINKEIVETHQCIYLDITLTTRLMKDNPALIASDGLHPSGMEYAEWAKLLAPLINAGIK